MNATALKSTLIDLLSNLAPEIDFATVDENANLQEEIEIDSFDFLNFLIAVDKELGVNVPESDYGKVMTLADLMDYIGERTS